MSENNGNSDGSGCYYAFIAAIILFILLGFGGCVKACTSPRSSSSYSDGGGYSSYGDDAAADEASHYHYDSNGHIYDDRD